MKCVRVIWTSCMLGLIGVFAHAGDPSDLPAAAKRLMATKAQKLEMSGSVAEVSKKPDSSIKVSDGLLICKNKVITENIVRKVSDSPIIMTSPQIWPGNLLRGKSFANGKLASISIKRSKGELVINSHDSQSTKRVDEMTLAKVTKAQKDFLSQKVGNAKSPSTFKVIPAYSKDQIAYALGIDTRFNNVNFDSVLKLNTSTNYAVGHFIQTYYTIDFKDPADVYSVFRDGKDFKDSDFQIGSKKENEVNPPLYISRVGYGRQLLILLSSPTQSPTQLQAVLQAAYENNSEKDSSRYEENLKNTTIEYLSIGGLSLGAVQPILAKTPGAKFQAIKDFIEDEKNSHVSQKTQGLPISYTVKYLVSGEVVSLAQGTSYNHKTCELEKNAFFSFSLESPCSEGEVSLLIIDPGAPEEKIVFTGRPDLIKSVNLDEVIPQSDQYYKIRILESKLANPRCNQYALKRTHRVDSEHPARNPGDIQVTDYLDNTGSLVPEYTVMNNLEKDLGKKKRSDFQIMMNRVSGRVQVTQFDSLIDE